MTVAQYLTHPSPAVRRAFLRGADARLAGQPLSANPYRRTGGWRARARRGSWSETYTLAWSTGWHNPDAAPGVVIPLKEATA